MDSDLTPSRLSGITTLWSVLREAHEGKGETATAAQELLIRRYGEAVRRYLLAAVRDPHAADELTQEFALALVRGSFHAADPQHGRFRDYVKTVLFHLVSKYREAQKKRRAVLAPDSPALAKLAAPAHDADQAFDQACREDLLARAWDALADAHPTYYAVLRFKTEHDQMPYAEVAAQLGRQLGKPLTADGARQAMHRARELYADLLLEEVARSLESPTLERVTEELGELNLLIYCQPALDRYSRQRKGS